LGARKQPKGQKGQQPHVPTDETRRKAWFMAATGVPQIKIGRSIGISDRTLSEYYRRELDLGMPEANTTVAKNRYRIATGTSPQAASAAMFWLKTRAGWRETGPPDEEGENKPPAIYINYVTAKKKDEPA
jgi:hypothetical protein